MNKIGDLVSYSKKVVFSNGSQPCQITLYCKPLNILRYETGLIKGYEVLVVFEVEEYSLGNNPASSRIEIFSPKSVPPEVELYFSIWKK